MTKIAHVSIAVSDDTSLPQLDWAALTAAGYVVPEFEEGAAEDYLFDAASSSVLRSRISGDELALVGTAPTYAANYLTVAAGINGLHCATYDQSAISFAAIFQRPVSGPSAALAIIGSDSGASAGSIGLGLHITNTGGYALSVRPGTGDPSISGAVGGPVVPAGSWAFVAGTINDTSATLFLGAPSPIIVAGTITSRTLGDRIGIGKVREMGASYDDATINVHRAVVFKRELSTAEITALYRRCKIVAARRGVTVV